VSALEIIRQHRSFVSSPAFGAIFLVLLFIAIPDCVYADPEPRKGLFLVATDKLNGTSFQETVILLTHYGKDGATGLAINRPTDIPLNQALPEIRQLDKYSDPLFLGGPMKTHHIFVLMRTLEPKDGMYHITDNLYFSTGKKAFGYATSNKTHAYAGYAGWAPGQLQFEIDRGDWLVVKTDPGIVFDKNLPGLWTRLKNRWSGDWI